MYFSSRTELDEYPPRQEITPGLVRLKKYKTRRHQLLNPEILNQRANRQNKENELERLIEHRGRRDRSNVKVHDDLAFLYVDPMICRPVVSYTGTGPLPPKITSPALA